MTDTFKLETAACLWEAALDLRTRGLREVPSLSLESQVNPEADPLAQAIVEWFEGNGFCECT